MESTVSLTYNQLFALLLQLPKDERVKMGYSLLNGIAPSSKSRENRRKSFNPDKLAGALGKASETFSWDKFKEESIQERYCR